MMLRAVVQSIQLEFYTVVILLIFILIISSSSSIRALKTCLEARTCLENENPCLEKSRSVLQFIFTSILMLFYINIPFKFIVSDALRIARKHECI